MIFFRIEKNPSLNESPQANIDLKGSILKFHRSLDDIDCVESKDSSFFVYGGSRGIIEKEEKIYFIDGFISSIDSSPRNQFESDLECIVSLFEEGRVEEIRGLKGQFTVGFYCKKTSEIQIFNDYFGFKMVFWAESDRYLYLSSRYQLISERDDFSNEIDRKALEEYLATGLVFHQKTFFKKIRQLPAGAELKWNRSGFSISGRAKRAFDFSYFSRSMGDIADEFSHLLSKSLTFIISRFKADRMLLTGGSDSRILLGCLSKEQRANIEFNTFENPEWSPNGNDVAIARQLGERYGLNHRVFNRANQVNFTNQSMAELSYKNKGHFSKELTGTFGTELVGLGPWKYLPTHYTTFRYDYLRHYQKFLFQSGAESGGDFYDLICENVDSQLGPCKEYQFFVPFFWRSFYSDIYSQHGTFVFISPYEMLNFQKLSPFLMPEVVDFLLKLPREALVNYRLYGELFKGRLKEWTEVPFNSEMTKYVGHIKVMPKDHTNKNIYSFPFHEYLQKHANHEAFDLDFLQEGGIMGLKWPKDASHIVRFVDYLFWYENAVLLNSTFGEELKEQ